MENGLSAQALRHPALVLASLPDSFRMQLGPFNPQIQDVKGLSSLHSLNASAFRLRYGSGYPGFPSHLLHHLPPQLFPAVDPRAVPFASGAFRPFNLSSNPKLFPQPSAFAPPLKSDSHNSEKGQDLSPGAFVPKSYENEEDSCFRSPSDREMDHSSCDLNAKTADSIRGPEAGSPQKSNPLGPIREENDCGSNKNFDTSSNVESDTSGISTPDDDRVCKRPKLQFDPTCCPICGQMVMLGEVETHFTKEVERLSQLDSLSRERKYLLEKVHPCFGSFTNGYGEENGVENGLPRGRWETFQRIKSNRLGRLRIKHRRRRNGDSPSCPVCNEKLQGSVEDINLHVEHCLKKHSEIEEEEDENIDVEGDSETFGEYEWAGRHLARATTSFLVGGIAAGLLSSASSANARKLDKDEEDLAVDVEDGRSSGVSPMNGSEDLNVEEETTSSSLHQDSLYLSKTSINKRNVNGN